ncbi:MAG TPA: hypothetical protein VNA17_06550 [Pyrinomonadaceae bacterium]|nr:hypothetical protein [Pyrinomonadaceae bacterium]
MIDRCKLGLFLLLLFGLAAGAAAQVKKSKKSVNDKPRAAVVIEETARVPAPEPDNSPKTNARPSAETPQEGKKNGRDSTAPVQKADLPVYFYEFTRPGFTYSRVSIAHDEKGRGKISFERDGSDEVISDPVNLSALTISRLDEALAALNFLDSNDEYQHSRDFSHMGNVQITVRKNGRERTAKYNWTDNKHAKAMMDEYRRIANEYTWRFEISVARENQQLQTPGMIKTLDSYLERGEISDPAQLLPFLSELSTDERLPLMARNHAARLIKQIEKAKK